MVSLSTIDKIIDITIKVFIFWVCANIYILIQFFFNSHGTYGILFDLQFFGSDFIGYVFRFLVMWANLFLCFIFSVLLWIFVLWMIILIFVPFIIVFPIPIIPFFVIVPLKFLLLFYVPPFRTLTERGILPLCRKIVFRFIFSEKTLKDKFKSSFADIYSFLFDEIKNTLGGIVKNAGIVSKDDEYKIKTVDDGTDNEAKANAVMKEDTKGHKNKEVMDLINEELQICLKTKQVFTTPESGLLSGADNLKNYAECYSKSIKSYIKNKT
jgi:hypothetical protein